MKISLILKNKTIIISYPINFTFCILQVFCTQPWHCIPVLQLISKNWWWRIWRSIRNLKRGTYDIIRCISGTFCFLLKKFTCFWKGMHVSDDHINYAKEKFLKLVWPPRSFNKFNITDKKCNPPGHLVKFNVTFRKLTRFYSCPGTFCMIVTHCQGLLYQVHIQCQGSCRVLWND